jgi:hypothetical protein
VRNSPTPEISAQGNRVSLRQAERGAGRLKSFVWLAILGVMVYVGWKVFPVMMSDYNFQDAMQTTARFASVNRQSPQDIRDSLVKEAAKQDIPVKPEDIHVTNDEGNVQIDAQYSVTVDLQFYQWTINFHPSAHNSAL